MHEFYTNLILLFSNNEFQNNSERNILQIFLYSTLSHLIISCLSIAFIARRGGHSGVLNKIDVACEFFSEHLESFCNTSASYSYFLIEFSGTSLGCRLSHREVLSTDRQPSERHWFDKAEKTCALAPKPSLTSCRFRRRRALEL